MKKKQYSAVLTIPLQSKARWMCKLEQIHPAQWIFYRAAPISEATVTKGLTQLCVTLKETQRQKKNQTVREESGVKGCSDSRQCKHCKSNVAVFQMYCPSVDWHTIQWNHQLCHNLPGFGSFCQVGKASFRGEAGKRLLWYSRIHAKVLNNVQQVKGGREANKLKKKHSNWTAKQVQSLKCCDPR